MKKLLCLLTVMPALAFGQAPVFDSANFAVNADNNVILAEQMLTLNSINLIQNTELILQKGEAAAETAHKASVIASWADSIAKAAQTLQKATEYVELAGKIKDAIGDPMQIVGLLDDKLLNDKLGDTLGDLSALSTSVRDFSETGFVLKEGVKDLYSSPIDFKNPIESFEHLDDRMEGRDPLLKYSVVDASFQYFVDDQAGAKEQVKATAEGVKKIMTKKPTNQIDAQHKANELAAAKINSDIAFQNSMRQFMGLQAAHIENQNVQDREFKEYAELLALKLKKNKEESEAALRQSF